MVFCFFFFFSFFLVMSQDRFRKVLGFILKTVAYRLSHSYTCGFLKLGLLLLRDLKRFK